MTSPNIYGLILAGGKSKRMGQDKSKIRYYGQEHRIWLYTLLNKYVDPVFISVKSFDKEIDEIPQLEDTINDYGPMVAILSAFKKHSEVAWFILACDLPFVNEQIITRLLTKRDPSKHCTAIRSSNKSYAEPLMAIWEPSCYRLLLENYENDNNCPRKILQSISHEELIVHNEDWVYNANTIKDRDWVMQKKIVCRHQIYQFLRISLPDLTPFYPILLTYIFASYNISSTFELFNYKLETDQVSLPLRSLARILLQNQVIINIQSNYR